MQFVSHVVRVAVASCFAVLGTGCGDGLTKGRAAAALENSFPTQGVCWATSDMANTRFPLRVNFDSSQRDGNAILGALAQSGLVSLSNKHVVGNPNGLLGHPVMLVELTDAGRQAEAWHEQHGFCIGTKVVDDVLQWTEPTRASDVQVSRVSYTWRITGVPAWARAPAFHALRGMDEPVEATATLRKMNDGWAVVP